MSGSYGVQVTAESNSNLVMQNMQLSYNPHPQVTPSTHFSSAQVSTRPQPVPTPQSHPQVTPQTHFATPVQVN